MSPTDQQPTRRRRAERPSGGAVISLATERRIADEAPEAELEKIRRGEYDNRQITDPFAATSVDGMAYHNIVSPPYNPTTLMRLITASSVLSQCVSAMEINISGHGHRLAYIGPEGQEESAEAKTEAEHIHGFLDSANGEYSMADMMRRVRWDLEVTGNGYIEVVRDATNRVAAAWHVPSYMMRITEADREGVEAEVKLSRFGKVTVQKVKRHFRRFVQMHGASKVYFKEYGDFRRIDPKTGKEAEGLPLAESATEVIHLKLYHGGSLYGIPRWINNVVALQGARQSELTNLDYFSDNAIPALLVTISGGSLTQETMDSLSTHLAGIRGRKSQNRVVVLEAYGDEDAASQDGVIPPPSVNVQPLGKDRQQDGLFMDYDKACTDKVRSSFRLPPIFLGLSEDYTHATANTSYEVGEGQVFGPERRLEEETVNQKILGGYDLKYWAVRSNPPRIADPQELLNSLSAFENAGAMTPNVAIGLANEVFDMDIKLVDAAWGNYPFSVIRGLAQRGMVEGWEDVMKEIDPATVPGAPGKPAPGTGGAKDGDGDGKAAEGDTKQKLARKVRENLMSLRNVLVEAENAEREAAGAVD